MQGNNGHTEEMQPDEIARAIWARLGQDTIANESHQAFAEILGPDVADNLMRTLRSAFTMGFVLGTRAEKAMSGAGNGEYADLIRKRLEAGDIGPLRGKTMADDFEMFGRMLRADEGKEEKRGPCSDWPKQNGNRMTRYL